MPTITNALGQILYTDDREQIYEQMAGKYLRNAQLSGLDLQGVDFRDCNLAEASFEGSNLSRCKFDKSDLSKANLRNVILDGASLKAANLEEANLENASMQGADLEEANLKMIWAPRVNLTSSNLRCVDLSEADVANAIVVDARFSSTRMDQTNITGVDFSRDILLKANHGGVFTTSTWNGAENTVDWWPPREFHSSSSDPVFDKSTTWPRGMRFPKRTPRFKDIAIHAAWIWGALWLVLFIGFSVGVGGTTALVLYCRDSWTIPFVAIAFSVAAELFRVIRTNQIIETTPELYFSSTIHVVEKGIYCNRHRPNGSGYYLDIRQKRTESFWEFLWSMMQSE